jgi:DNA-nicking Smr family endonuclease
MGDGKKNKGRPPKLPAVDPIDEAEAERLFLESLENMDPQAILRDKRRGLDEKEPVARPRPGRGGDGQADYTLDLHRLTLAEAQGRIDGVLRQILGRLAAGPVTLKVITGKGRHSLGSSVLPREIHDYVKSRYAAHIHRIDDSPADLVVGELPLRGHFNVTFGKK